MANSNLNKAKEAKKDDLRDLSFRTFDKKQKREAYDYERQQGICVQCNRIKGWK